MTTHIYKVHLPTLIAVMFIGLNGVAQEKSNPCSNSLSTANKEYEAGRFTSCIEILNPCVSDLANSEVFEAYRLLALCHQALNDEKNTHIGVVNLLRNKPDYRDFPYFDPLDFTKLLVKYDVWPKLELGIIAGINLNSVNPIKNYSLTGSPAEYLPGRGFQAGIVFEYFIRKNISVNTGLLFEGLNYERNAADVSGWKQEYQEKINYFSIPVSGRYYFLERKSLRMAAEIGLQTQLLNGTNSNIILSNNTTSENVQNTIDQSGIRNKTLFYGLAGIALKYKLAGGNVCASVFYAYGFGNVVNADKRYEPLGFIMANQYVDSDFSFNPLYISLGYQMPMARMYAVKLRK